MKIFQIENGLCYWEATRQFPNMETIKERYPPSLLFIEAPDYVFEGWGYDPFKTGDDRFVKPIPPEGWLYDDATGTFYPADMEPPFTKTPEQIYSELTEALQMIADSL